VLFLCELAVGKRHESMCNLRALQVLRNEKVEQKRQERAIEQQIEQIRRLNGHDEGDASTSGAPPSLSMRLYLAQGS
jgi:hypothetical protein